MEIKLNGMPNRYEHLRQQAIAMAKSFDNILLPKEKRNEIPELGEGIMDSMEDYVMSILLSMRMHLGRITDMDEREVSLVEFTHLLNEAAIDFTIAAEQERVINNFSKETFESINKMFEELGMADKVKVGVKVKSANNNSTLCEFDCSFDEPGAKVIEINGRKPKEQ